MMIDNNKDDLGIKELNKMSCDTHVKRDSSERLLSIPKNLNNNTVLKEDKMKHKIKKQFVLCFLTKTNVVVDAKNAAHGIDIDTVEDMTLEVFGTFDSRFEALQELQTHAVSEYEFTILETLKVVQEAK